MKYKICKGDRVNHYVHGSGVAESLDLPGFARVRFDKQITEYVWLSDLTSLSQAERFRQESVSRKDEQRERLRHSVLRNKAQFREVGGFNRLNKIFNGELSQILENLTDLVWQMQA